MRPKKHETTGASDLFRARLYLQKERSNLLDFRAVGATTSGKSFLIWPVGAGNR